MCVFSFSQDCIKPCENFLFHIIASADVVNFSTTGPNKMFHDTVLKKNTWLNTTSNQLIQQ